MTHITQLATLFQGYLDTAASHTAGVPAWPIQIQDDGSTLRYPSIVIRADDRTGSRVRTCIVTATVHSAPEPDDDAIQLAADAALAAINTQLQDEDAIWAHIAAAAENLRTGWTLHHITHPTPDDVKRDEAESTSALHAVIQLLIQVH